MLAEAAELLKIANNVCIKVPLTIDGLKTCKALTDQRPHGQMSPFASPPIRRCWQQRPAQPFISPFIGRLDDININGMELIEDIRTIYDNYGFRNRNFGGVHPHCQPCQGSRS